MAAESAKTPRLRDVGTDLFFNRELSFLELNQRILHEAADETVPLLERLKFVAIVSTNLDEFFMVRVAGLQQQLRSGVMETGPDGMTPSEQLSAISQRVKVQVAEQERLLLDDVLPALAAEGIRLVRMTALNPAARKETSSYFDEQIFPILTPLAVDPGHPFPFLKNRTLNLAIHLLPEAADAASYPLLAVVQVPALPRFHRVLDEDDAFTVVPIEQLIASFAARLFPGMRLLECVPFRVIRNWDLSVDEDEQEDLLEAVQKELRTRWRLDAVRLEVGSEASAELVGRLQRALALEVADVQLQDGPLALGDLGTLLSKVGRSDLRDPPFTPGRSPSFPESDDIFTAIRRSDILLHHPYESYEPVIDLVEQASRDPSVMAIKQTLYRVNRGSPLLRSLVTAAQNGKQVTALVELKARFDEEVNVEWARVLEGAGVHVVYGMVGLKTHCKVTMIVRREPQVIRRYVHLGTGNYNEQTAAIYSDLSFFTCADDVCGDVSSLFNLLTGYSAPPRWKKLAVAPLRLRRDLLTRIDRARDTAREGGKAKIVIKSNAIIDRRTIRALSKAAQAGVDVKLLIRGPCSMRIGVPGVTDQIEVRVIIDRFLEHSRIMYFDNDGEEDVLLTSTDIMPRNFDRRVEVMLPIEDPRLKHRIIHEILALELADTTKAAVLQPNGTYRRLRSKSGAGLRAQSELIKLAQKRSAPKKDKKDKKRHLRDT